MLGDGTEWGRIDRREDPAVHGDEVRREDHLDRTSSHLAQHLVNLRRVTVPADAIGREVLVALGIVCRRLGRSACARDATLGVDDDADALDQSLGNQRSERQDARRGITSGIGDQSRGGNSFPEQLGKTVDRLTQARRIVVVVAVPVGIDTRVLEPVIGAQVDHPDASLAQARSHFQARGMREGEEGHIGKRGHSIGVEWLAGQVDPTGQARVHGIQTRGASSDREGGQRDPGIGMVQRGSGSTRELRNRRLPRWQRVSYRLSRPFAAEPEPDHGEDHPGHGGDCETLVNVSSSVNHPH